MQIFLQSSISTWQLVNALLVTVTHTNTPSCRDVLLFLVTFYMTGEENIHKCSNLARTNPPSEVWREPNPLNEKENKMSERNNRGCEHLPWKWAGVEIGKIVDHRIKELQLKLFEASQVWLNVSGKFPTATQSQYTIPPVNNAHSPRFENKVTLRDCGVVCLPSAELELHSRRTCRTEQFHKCMLSSNLN